MHRHGEGDDAPHAEFGKPLANQRARSLRAVPLAPRRFLQPVAEFDLIRVTPWRWAEMEPTQEVSGLLLDCRPEAKSFVALVIAQECGQEIVLDFVARRCPATGDELHHLRVAIERDEV